MEDSFKVRGYEFSNITLNVGASQKSLKNDSMNGGLIYDISNEDIVVKLEAGELKAQTREVPSMGMLQALGTIGQLIEKTTGRVFAECQYVTRDVFLADFADYVEADS
jgi:hypothetical protein